NAVSVVDRRGLGERGRIVEVSLLRPAPAGRHEPFDSTRLGGVRSQACGERGQQWSDGGSRLLLIEPEAPAYLLDGAAVLSAEDGLEEIHRVLLGGRNPQSLTRFDRVGIFQLILIGVEDLHVAVRVAVKLLADLRQ